MKRQKIFFFSIFFLLAFFATTKNARALASYYAATCGKIDIKAAMANCLADSDCKTVNIPSGDCTWDTASCDSSSCASGGSGSCIRFNAPAHDLEIKGAGKDNTIIRFSSTGSACGFFYFDTDDDKNTSIYIRDLQLYTASDRTHNAVIADDPKWLEVSNVIFDGAWHTMIGGKRIDGGLIYGSTFRNDRSSFSSNYGISSGQNTFNQPTSYKTCDGPGGPSNSAWEAWLADPVVQGGIPFKANWNPADTEQALFVEDNTFYWRGSAMEMNWYSTRSNVWRHNTIYNDDGNSGGVKPGAWYSLIYENIFENRLAPFPNNAAIYLRSDGLVFGNTFRNYIRGGQLSAYCYYQGLYSVPTALMKELYIWGNYYENASCPGDNSNCWTKWNEGAPERISESVNYFFRAPQTGERLAGYTLPIYPHPRRNEDQSSDTTPPTSPTGVMVI